MNERDIITIAREKLCGLHLGISINGHYRPSTAYELFKIVDIVPVMDYTMQGGPYTGNYYLIGEGNREGSKCEKVTFYTLSLLIEKGYNPDYGDSLSESHCIYISEVFIPKLTAKADDLSKLTKEKHLYRNDICLGEIINVRVLGDLRHFYMEYSSYSKGEGIKKSPCLIERDIDAICNGATIDWGPVKYKVIA